MNNNPISRMKEIQNTMNETLRYHYTLVSMSDAINRLKNVKQFETEFLLDFVARFK